MFRIWLVVALFGASFSASLAQGLGSDKDGLVRKIVEANLLALNKVNSLSLKSTIKYHFSEDFMKQNPIDYSDITGRSDIVEYTGDLESFAYTVNSVSAAGQALPVHRLTFDDDRTSILDSNVPVTLWTSKGLVREANDRFDFKNPLFSVLSFLSLDKKTADRTMITLADIRDREKWGKFLASCGRISVDGENDEAVVKFERVLDDGGYDVVYFQGTAPFLPLKYERLNAKKELERAFKVESWETFEVEGTKLSFPATAIATYYFDGWLVNTGELALGDVKINPVFDDAIFFIDPASVEDIWDNDNNVRINVPK